MAASRNQAISFFSNLADRLPPSHDDLPEALDPRSGLANTLAFAERFLPPLTGIERQCAERLIRLARDIATVHGTTLPKELEQDVREAASMWKATIQTTSGA